VANIKKVVSISKGDNKLHYETHREEEYDIYRIKSTTEKLLQLESKNKKKKYSTK
jgi:hypothetical protein